MDDVLADPVVYYQHKYYIPGVLIFSVFLPTFIPWYFWGEDLLVAYMVCVSARYVVTLNFTWLVNSVAHLFGNKPYDKAINAVENLGVALAAFGEGWHNYHHTFPWDYKTAELGIYSTNLTSLFIDTMAVIGQAYDRKSVDDDMIRKRALRTGDGTHHSIQEKQD
ncbi:unnamed protein product [Notodromas monacha]|uniref:Uncharacterized protein n=1 Tax=Notodromas monacha TaxID=399045 RepID=A0A7R9BFP4_9CRUS|nr:unnamed protein product [Notodromas monacha]CAG0914576.1 unnamed protein product [Notodromas monacha]